MALHIRQSWASHSMAVVAVRMAQMSFCQRDTLPLSKQIVTAKIKNQRAVLNHLHKYHRHPALQSAAGELLLNVHKARQTRDVETLLGFEGASANAYFQGLRKAKLFSSSFSKREGRGSQEINNAMLNLGYAVLSSYILNAIINAGLEPYLGIMHGQRPGKMALVLDLMEEYRAWVVDRVVIKLRSRSEDKKNTGCRTEKSADYRSTTHLRQEISIPQKENTNWNTSSNARFTDCVDISMVTEPTNRICSNGDGMKP